MIATASELLEPLEYTLRPWRIRQGGASGSAISLVCKPVAFNRSQITTWKATGDISVWRHELPIPPEVPLLRLQLYHIYSCTQHYIIDVVACRDGTRPLPDRSEMRHFFGSNDLKRPRDDAETPTTQRTRILSTFGPLRKQRTVQPTPSIAFLQVASESVAVSAYVFTPANPMYSFMCKYKRMWYFMMTR